MAAKILAFLFLISGLLRPQGTNGQYEEVPADLDAHTDPAYGGEEFGYDDFTPDESDIKNPYGHESDNHDHIQNGNGHADNTQRTQENVGNSQADPVHGGSSENVNEINDHEGQNGEKMTVEDVLKRELRMEEESKEDTYAKAYDKARANEKLRDDLLKAEESKEDTYAKAYDKARANEKLRDDLLKAEEHDNFQKMNERLAENGNAQQRESRTENNGNNNGNSETGVNDGDLNTNAKERPIKEIHDIIDAKKSQEDYHVHETQKHQEGDRKEQKSVKISKLIFAAKKNGEDVKHSDTSFEGQNGQSAGVKINVELKPEAIQPNNVQSSSGGSEHSEKAAVTGVKKQWVDEIVMTDGGILRLNNPPNHLVDTHSESNDLKSDLKKQGDEQKNDLNHQESKETNSVDQSATKSADQKSAEVNSGTTVHEEPLSTPQNTFQSSETPVQVSEEKSNDDSRQHDSNNGNSINASTDGERNEKTKEREEKIFQSAKFLEMKRRYISRYLDDHYKGKKLSQELLNQISELITNDLKGQWRNEQMDILMESEHKEENHAGHSIDEENKDKKTSDNIPQEKGNQHVESEYQKVSTINEEHQKHTSNGDNEINIATEPVKKTGERVDGRPARSILSSMVRSSQSLSAHEKSHLSSIATAQSSISSVMTTKDNTRPDLTMNTASTSVLNTLSTATAQLDTKKNTKEAEINEIDISNSVDLSKKTDDTYTDIFAPSENGSKTDVQSEQKEAENISQVKSSIDGSDNETKQEMDKKGEPNNDGQTTKSKIFKTGDPFTLSVMSDPDPKINKLIQLPEFQDLRKTQVESYLDAQFAGKYITEEELKVADDLISKSMRKDIGDRNSGLYAWIIDSVGEENLEEEKPADEHHKKLEDEIKPDPLEGTVDQKDKSDHKEEIAQEEKNDSPGEIEQQEESGSTEGTTADDKDDLLDQGVSHDAAGIIKAKRKKLLKILSGSHHNDSLHPGDTSSDDVSSDSSISAESVKNNEDGHGSGTNIESAKEEIKQSEEHEINGDTKKEDTGGYLDSIWGFFGGSTIRDTETDKDSSVENGDIAQSSENVDSSESKEKSDENKERSADDTDYLTISPAEDNEVLGTEPSDENVGTPTTSKPETTTESNILKKHNIEESIPISTAGEDKPVPEPTVSTVVKGTSEFLETVTPKEVKFPTSASKPTEASTTTSASTSEIDPVTTTAAAAAFTTTASSEITTTATTTSDSQTSELVKEKFKTDSSIEKKSSETKDILEKVESVDMEHEKLKYKETNLDHETTAKIPVVDDEPAETDPLKRLCKKYPTLKACQEVKPSAPISEPEEDTKKTDGSFAIYIKLFTRWINSCIYGIFAYIIQCIKSLVKVICYYTVGIILNILGKEEVSISMMEEYDAVSTERFAVFIFLFVSYTVFCWYYKNSTMSPIVKVSDGFDTGDAKKVKVSETQLKDLQKKMEKEIKEKKRVQVELEKEIDINQKIHTENKDLKRIIEENKGDKKQIKQLEKSIKDHENKTKGKDNELQKLNVSIKTIKEDLKENKDKYKLLEDKFRYVEKESDSKDETIADLEDRKKELENQLSGKNKDITEKGDLLESLNGRVSDLLEKHSILETNMKKEKDTTQALEEERKALQETLLNIDKLNYEGKLENGFHSIDGKDGALDMSMDDDIKAERLQNIINAITLKAEHLEAVTELTTCKEDLTVYRNKADKLEVNMNDLSSKFEVLSTESDELKKGIEKKNIELQTITKFFGERESEFQKLNINQKEEIQKLSKQMDLIGDEKREMGELIKKIDELKEEIEVNQKDYKQQLATVEEQSHANYLKMRNAIRECDEHKREKEVYRKRLLDIDMTPQAKTKTAAPVMPVSLDRSESPGSNKSTEALPDTSAGKPGPVSLPPAAPPYGPPMYRGAVPPFPPNPMATALYRVPPVGPYGMHGRPPFLPPMRPPLPHNGPMNTMNSSVAPTNMAQPTSMGQPNIPMGATSAPRNSNISQMGATSASMGAPNVYMNQPGVYMTPTSASMNSTYSNVHQPAMVPYSHSSSGHPMPRGQFMSTPPRMPMPGLYGMPPAAPMVPNQSTPNLVAGAGFPRNMTPISVATGVVANNS